MIIKLIFKAKTNYKPQSLPNQFGAKPKGDDKGENGKAEHIVKRRNKRVDTASQTKSAVKSSKAESPSRKFGDEKGNPDESPRSQEEEDRQTQPFWEGLASEDKILQSRAERLAREKKRKKQMERRMRKRIEVKWQKKKEGKKHILSKEAENRRGDAPTVQTEQPTQRLELKNSCWREAEELWGLGDSKKRRGLRDLIRKEGAYIVFIQESKMEVCDDRKCKYIWGGDNCRWVMKAAHGKSGDKLPCYFLNVYAPCDSLGKKLLWKEILDLMEVCDGGNWCIGGDFNAIRSREEKRGRHFNNTAMRDFNSFIEEAGLEDLPLTGRKFTWFKSDGSAMSRLDRFLVSTGFLINFPDLIQKGLSRDISDHCPVMLISSSKDWGPKPFRSLDCWFEIKEFSPFVHEKWNSYNVEGWKGFRLKEKFKLLKNDLKEWNMEVFGYIDRNLKKIRGEIKNLDDKAENGELSETEIEQRRSCFQQFWEWNLRKDSLLCQKSRQKWLQEGDANSKYFHGCIVKRRRRNGIEGVMKNDAWVDEVPEVKKVIKEFFEFKFQEHEWDRPSLESNDLKQLSPEDNSWLTAKFSEEEVKAAVWNCNKKFWANERLVKGSNSSFIVLIPKKESPQGLGYFRPISLVGCLYKIISKLLANRLRKVMPTIISQNQSAFVGKRYIADGIVIANEVIYEAKKRRRPTLIFKADFEKTYDSVNWKFLELMMENFGFCLKWRKWIKECLTTSSVFVLVNGSHTAEFSMEKGLRQGDPLALFLFLLVAEALNGLIHKAKELNMYKGVEMGEERLEVTHLQFADDSIFFCDASDSNIKAIKGILRTFELVSGLEVNFFKSALYGINVKAEEISECAESLNCMVGAMPFKYLGDLEKLLKECKLMKGKQDFWSWKHDSKGTYSTKSAYSLLNISIEEPGSIQFNKIWNSKVPLKVSAFVCGNSYKIEFLQLKQQVTYSSPVRSLGQSGKHSMHGGDSKVFSHVKVGSICSNIQA
ncbi:hypothetical protein SLEP1_g30818 [Rubroshorea leprosula]|uniref:Reverse transcriptase domain-containing protein n=1 Tax=Rubroshorea leprosula TaxID=152421 RepID=A0AAV5K6S8_9ROSI|nr:hypothetical protein SLEP1_g30818 [Rubroshorea leprosula]